MSRAAAVPLVFGAAVVVAAEFVVIGLLPALSAELALTPAQAGWLITLFALASALFGPPLVAASARWPAAAVLAASLLPFAANLLLLAFPGFALALVLRVLQGAALPLFMSVASVRLGAAFGPGRGVALLYAGVTFGGTLAPPAGSFLAEWMGWRGPMALIGLLALPTALGCLAYGGRDRTDAVQSPWRLLARPAIQTHLALSTLTFAAMFSGFSFIALLLAHAGLGGERIAGALFCFGLAGLGGNWLAGRFAGRALPGTAAAALAVAAVTALIAATPGGTLLAIAIAGWGAAHAAGFVFCQIRLMAAAPEAPGFASSLNIAAANIGIALGSLAGGRAIELGGVRALWGIAFAFALLAAATALLCRRRNVTKQSLLRHRSETGIAPE